MNQGHAQCQKGRKHRNQLRKPSPGSMGPDADSLTRPTGLKSEIADGGWTLRLALEPPPFLFRRFFEPPLRPALTFPSDAAEFCGFSP